MIEIYIEIGKALSATNRLKWIDKAPRIAEQTNLYPAAYIRIDGIRPLNTLGGDNGISEVDFTVEYWFKPYKDSKVKPLSPVLDSLTKHLEPLRVCRKAILDFQGEYVQNTTLINEAIDTDEQGYYFIRQQWRCLTWLWYSELVELPDIPVIFQAENKKAP